MSEENSTRRGDPGLCRQVNISPIRNSIRRRKSRSRSIEGLRTKFRKKLQDIRSGISILEAVARPVNPGRALRLASRLLDLFGRLPPEVVEAVTFFYLQGIERVEDPSVFCEVVAPNFEDLKRLRIALIEAIFNSLVNMP
ncbi:uncharacterized protein LOC141525787 isoform X1 [Cotesia typhae]|uniref:uncharacterized protein LOC141525787 isoform X1 n=1 Tax=Cotesia typhae TaxID=2053667 RepID=UPI003D69F202